MKGYIFIDRHFAKDYHLVEELLTSSFLESDYEIRINVSKSEFAEKWNDLAFDTDENDSLRILAFALRAISFPADSIKFDDGIDYSNLKKIKANEDLTLNSIFCLPEDPGISYQYGVSVVESNDKNVLKQPKNRPIQNGESVSWSNLLPQDYWNSIIIADCYILKDKATIERNLFPIIDKGCSSSNKVQITIFTQFAKDGRELLWNGAFSLLKSRYPKANIEIIDVFEASREIHDRSILTNHYYIHLPGGSDLLDAGGKSTKHTKVITYKYPQFYDVAKDDFDDFCSSAKAYRENARNKICDKKEFKNRLIY